MWEKHVLEAQEESKLTNKLLEFLNEQKVVPGGVIVREVGRKSDPVALKGWGTGNELHTLTVLRHRQS